MTPAPASRSCSRKPARTPASTGGATTRSAASSASTRRSTTLAGIPGIPKVYDLFWVGEHRFLVMEFVDGDVLGKAIVLRYPLIDPSATTGEVRHLHGVGDGHPPAGQRDHRAGPRTGHRLRRPAPVQRHRARRRHGRAARLRGVRAGRGGDPARPQQPGVRPAQRRARVRHRRLRAGLPRVRGVPADDEPARPAPVEGAAVRARSSPSTSRCRRSSSSRQSTGSCRRGTPDVPYPADRARPRGMARTAGRPGPRDPRERHPGPRRPAVPR